jgi:uncharacterized protein YggU (UPF0235/DUF167 family)
MSVAVKTGLKTEGYEILNDGTMEVSIKERPVENNANKAVIRKISEIYDKPKNKIAIKTGLKSKK